MTALLLSVPDAAQAMGVSESTMWRLIRGRQIATVPMPAIAGRGKRNARMVERAEIDAFIAAHRQPATSPG